MTHVRNWALLNGVLLTMLVTSAGLTFVTHPRIAAATLVIAIGHVIAMVVRYRGRRLRLSDDTLRHPTRQAAARPIPIREDLGRRHNG